jgi:acyl carrier protein phosphodiesterase
MNFLLHRHLAARDIGHDAAGAGAMLPDLWRMADRRVRPALEASFEAPGTLAHVLAGVLHHVRADHWFHRDAVFVDGEREATARLKEAKLEARRSVLFGHVLWELCLDGELVRREGVAVRDRVEDGFHLADRALDQAAELHHFSRVPRTPEERATFTRRMQRIVRELSQGEWIPGYADDEGIAERLQGVRRRLGLALMGPADVGRLTEVARLLRASASDAVTRILAHPSL